MLFTADVVNAVHTSTFLLGEGDDEAGLGELAALAAGEAAEASVDSPEQPARANTTTKAERVATRGFMTVTLSGGS
jgi:hypothetical protein